MASNLGVGVAHWDGSDSTGLGRVSFALLDWGRVEFGIEPFQLDWLLFGEARKTATQPSDERRPFAG